MEQREAVVALTALAQDRRLSVFRTLVQAGPNGLSAGEVADAVGSLPSTMSHHLGTLEKAGLLRSHRAGRSVVYAADYEGMRRLLAFLMEDCCQGKAEFCGDGLSASLACSTKETC